MTLHDCAAFLRQHDRYLILTHRRPDGDAVGSAAALCRGLRKLGKTAFALPNPEATPRHEEMLAPCVPPAGYLPETVVSVDLAEEGILQLNAEGWAGKISLSIDHHPSNSHYAGETFLDPDAGACGELIYLLMQELAVPVDKELATLLYIAVTMDRKYKRILLKMSGEALGGENGRGIDFDFTGRVCRAVKQCVDEGIQVSVVVGGGNYWRGGKDGGDRMVRARADYMGMLATAMNSVALVDSLEKAGVEAVIQASFGLERIAEPFNRDAAVRHLKAGRVVIFACGSGEPFFTTDTAAVLRALDIEADVLLLGKNVDGLYSADPKLDPTATKFDRIEYAEVLRRDLKAMDAAATQLAMENKLPLCVFGLKDPENIAKAAAGEAIGTIVE